MFYASVDNVHFVDTGIERGKRRANFGNHAAVNCTAVDERFCFRVGER